MSRGDFVFEVVSSHPRSSKKNRGIGRFYRRRLPWPTNVTTASPGTVYENFPAATGTLCWRASDASRDVSQGTTDPSIAEFVSNSADTPADRALTTTTAD